jgi:hypothetical protein
MQPGRYCITSPTIAVLKEKGRRVAGLVPKGSIIEITTETLDDNKLISVIWDGQDVMMFVQDLRTRTEPMKTSSAKQSRAARPHLAARAAT